MAAPRIVRHRKTEDGRYLLDVELASATDTDPAVTRRFEWGPLPVVPDTIDLAGAQDRYASVHDRPLRVGEPFVTEKEYVFLQIAEARDTLAVESRKAPAGKKLAGEGMEL